MLIIPNNGVALDRIDLFRCFIRVVDCTSFTRAAETLRLPRSSVSAAIAELEARMGARLLNRTTRRLSLTQDGAVLLDRCQRLVAELEETENLFRETGALPTGVLRVDMPGRIGRLLVAPALADFLDRYPGIEVVLGATDRAVDLIEDNLDCVLRVGPLVDSTLIARSLGSLPLINVASPAYLARHGTPQGPQDLAGHWAVDYASPSTGRVDPWEWVQDGVAQRCALRHRVTVNSAEAYIACCLAGHGLIQIPAYDVRAHLQQGELVEVMPDHRAAPLPMALLLAHRQYTPQRVKVFADWLEALLRARIPG